MTSNTAACFASVIQSLQRLCQIGNQVIGIFQADIESHQLPLMRPAATHALHAIRHSQTMHATPAETNLEQFEGINKTVSLRFAVLRIEQHREQATGTAEITLPMRMSRTVGQRRMQH